MVSGQNGAKVRRATIQTTKGWRLEGLTNGKPQNYHAPRFNDDVNNKTRRYNALHDFMRLTFVRGTGTRSRVDFRGHRESHRRRKILFLSLNYVWIARRIPPRASFFNRHLKGLVYGIKYTSEKTSHADIQDSRRKARLDFVFGLFIYYYYFLFFLTIATGDVFLCVIAANTVTAWKGGKRWRQARAQLYETRIYLTFLRVRGSRPS